MSIRQIVCVGLALFHCLSAAGAQHAEEWIVKNIIPPAPHLPGELSQWAWPTTQGDLNHDHRTDFVIHGTSDPQPFMGLPSWNQLRIYPGAVEEPAFKLNTRLSPRFFDHAFIHLPLQTPNGWVILLDSGIQQSIEAYDMTTGAQTGVVQLPPPPSPGVPPAGGFAATFPAGDVNHDGWDDAFWVTWSVPWIHAGLIDGASLTVAWEYYEGNHERPGIPVFGEPALRPDLDGDQIPDFLLAFSTYSLSQWGNVYAALSGRDGTLIWRRQGFGYGHLGNSWGKDLNHDGIADCVAVFGAEVLTAMDGATGNTLWQTDLDVLDPYLPPQWLGRVPLLTIPTLSINSKEPEIGIILDYSWFPPPAERRVFAQFDGASGTLTSFGDLPVTQMPWSQVEVGDAIPWMMGDVDRDGLMEIGHFAICPEMTPGWSTAWATSLVVLGQKTLFLPVSARIGSLVTAEVSIPSAAGMTYAVLLSTVFAPRGGWTADGVQTNLHPADGVFRATFGRPELRGRLGPEGKGRLSFFLPQQTGMIGKTLHARCVVRDPASGEVWTVSSPAALLITP